MLDSGKPKTLQNKKWNKTKKPLQLATQEMDAWIVVNSSRAHVVQTCQQRLPRMLVRSWLPPAALVSSYSARWPWILISFHPFSHSFYPCTSRANFAEARPIPGVYSQTWAASQSAVQTQITVLHPKTFWFTRSRAGQKTYISNKLLMNPAAGGPGTALWEPVG